MNINYEPPKPYKLQTDGDLWAIAHKALKAKGPHAVRVSKVKGHEDRAIEQLSPEQWREKVNNDEADTLAGEAYYALHGAQLKNLAQAYVDRFEEYVNFMHSIQCIILR
eukprot:7759587-Karenia_brevis.AAC.1